MTQFKAVIVKLSQEIKNSIDYALSFSSVQKTIYKHRFQTNERTIPEAKTGRISAKGYQVLHLLIQFACRIFSLKWVEHFIMGVVFTLFIS